MILRLLIQKCARYVSCMDPSVLDRYLLREVERAAEIARLKRERRALRRRVRSLEAVLRSREIARESEEDEGFVRV